MKHPQKRLTIRQRKIKWVRSHFKCGNLREYRTIQESHIVNGLYFFICRGKGCDLKSYLFGLIWGRKSGDFIRIIVNRSHCGNFENSKKEPCKSGNSYMVEYTKNTRSTKQGIFAPFYCTISGPKVQGRSYIFMAKKSAKGSGTIRKKTVTRGGKVYT